MEQEASTREKILEAGRAEFLSKGFLAAAMIADCSSLGQMFSHYIPQFFASIFSTLVIGACMPAWSWKMALAVLWVLPVAVLLTAVQEALSRLVRNKTVLIIAHRMRTVAGADKIVVLAEEGAPQSLLERNGIYANMAALQTESHHWALAK